jgi:putative acetyltransferase
VSQRIRPYRAEDAAAVREVHLQAFGGRGDEPRLVELLHAAGAAPVSLVAATQPDGRVVGHLLFSPVQIGGRETDLPKMVGLAPVGVLPEYQGRGIGSSLIREGLDACREAGYGAAVVLGEPGYYTRFGFERATNGNFETGEFTHWNGANQINGSGDWFVYEGTISPLSDHNIAAPPQGNFAATTDQEDPGSHVLYRNIKLESGMRHELSFYLYYRNRAGEFFTPDTLDFRHFPNQQYRVDLLRPKADPFTVNPNAIKATLFRTEVGDPNRLDPTLLTFNLTQFAGDTVRLRFAEVDNQDYFQASVDRVRVTSEPR